MSRSENYITVTAILAERREKAVRLDRSEWSAPVWLPRGWLDKSDDIRLNRLEVGTEVSLRVLGDRAQEKGLVANA